MHLKSLSKEKLKSLQDFSFQLYSQVLEILHCLKELAKILRYKEINLVKGYLPIDLKMQEIISRQLELLQKAQEVILNNFLIQ
jgi:hypothetical protein